MIGGYAVLPGEQLDQPHLLFVVIAAALAGAQLHGLDGRFAGTVRAFIVIQADDVIPEDRVDRAVR
ncbi:hypothetical protein D3C79_961600 [compost metagenome]